MRLGVVVVLLLSLAACGTDGTDGPDGEDEVSSGGETVSIDHRYGSTELDSVPERVVALDNQWTDTMLAFGVEPVGYAIDVGVENRTLPWQDLGAEAEQLDTSTGVPLEAIAALEPDLIVGTYTIADEALFEKLSGIAPTIPSLSESDFVEPWRELVAVGGEVLREPERAEEIVSEVDGEVDTVAGELPGLAGRTFALSQYVVGDSVYIVSDPEDGSSEFFQKLGMELYPPVLEEGAGAPGGRLNVSTERADLLRSDLLVFLVNGGDEADLADIPGFDALPGTVAVLDYATIVGLNTPSPLSIPYSLDQLRPFLEQAAA